MGRILMVCVCASVQGFAWILVVLGPRIAHVFAAFADVRDFPLPAAWSLCMEAPDGNMELASKLPLMAPRSW